MNRGLVYVTVYDARGEIVFTVGWVARSAIHRTLKVNAHRIVDARFYLVRHGATTQRVSDMRIIGVGKRTGGRGNWTRSEF